MRNQKGYSLAECLVLLLFIAGTLGYAMNIYHIATVWDNGLTVGLVIRVIGIIAFPIGAVLGYIPI